MNQTAAKISSINPQSNPVQNWDSEIWARFDAFLTEHDQWSINEVARNMAKIHGRGCSASALKAYRNKTYPVADCRPLEKKIVNWLDIQTGEGRVLARFRATQLTKAVFYGCNQAAKKNQIIVIVGDPGVGKSEALREFCLNYNKAIMRVDCYQGQTPKGFLQLICRELSLDANTSKHNMLMSITDKLKGSPALLVIDEGDFLSEESLNHLRYIWDHASLGVVLAGTSELHEAFEKNRRSKAARARLKRRVALTIQVVELSRSEVRAIIEETYDDATPETVQAFYAASSGIFGDLDQLIENVDDLREKMPKVQLIELIAKASMKLYAQAKGGE